MDATVIFLGLIFGSIGVGFFIYGKKQTKAVAMLSGAVLCILPYIVTDILWMILAGVILCALPFFFRY